MMIWTGFNFLSCTFTPLSSMSTHCTWTRHPQALISDSVRLWTMPTPLHTAAGARGQDPGNGFSALKQLDSLSSVLGLQATTTWGLIDCLICKLSTSVPICDST